MKNEQERGVEEWVGEWEREPLQSALLNRVNMTEWTGYMGNPEWGFFPLT